MLISSALLENLQVSQSREWEHKMQQNAKMQQKNPKMKKLRKHEKCIFYFFGFQFSSMQYCFDFKVKKA